MVIVNKLLVRMKYDSNSQSEKKIDELEPLEYNRGIHDINPTIYFSFFIEMDQALCCP